MYNLLWIIPVGMLCGTLLFRLITWFAWKHYSKAHETLSDRPYLTVFGVDYPTAGERDIQDAMNVLDTQEDSVDDENSFGSSGITPGGVPYSEVVGVGPIAKGRRMIGRK